MVAELAIELAGYDNNSDDSDSNNDRARNSASEYDDGTFSDRASSDFGDGAWLALIDDDSEELEELGGMVAELVIELAGYDNNSDDSDSNNDNSDRARNSASDYDDGAFSDCASSGFGDEAASLIDGDSEATAAPPTPNEPLPPGAEDDGASPRGGCITRPKSRMCEEG